MILIRDILYALALLVASPVFVVRALLGRRGMGGFGERRGNVTPRPGEARCLWVHGVSVGEVQAARSLVEGFAARHPDWDIVISSTTDTGRAAALRAFPGRPVIRYPFDFSFAVGRALSRIRPDLVVLMEGDIWPNFLRMTEARGIPVVVANGRVSDRHYPRSRRFRFLLAGSFARLARVAAQSEEYARRFEALGAPAGRVVVAGSLKYDAVPRETPDPAPLRRSLAVADDAPVLVAGSTTEGEEEILLDAYAALAREFPTLRLVIVPRHPERFDPVAELIRCRGFACVRRSSSVAGGDLCVPLQGKAVILGDTMGELMTFYAMAAIAFVGKSLVAPGGGQNMIEPAGLGKPVVFGPYTSNFRQTRDELVSQGAAREVKGAEDLAAAVKQLLTDEGVRTEMGSRARAVVDASRGATARTLDIIEEVLASAPKM